MNFSAKEEPLLTRNGKQMPVYSAIPQSSQPLPAVIVVHEIFGLNDHIRDVANRFARQNIAAFAPDLFAVADNLPKDRNDLNAMRTVWSQIPDAQLISDLQETYRYAIGTKQVLADKVGTIGFCMGGAIALIFASSTPEIAWTADFYGRVQYPQLSENKPKHPVDYVPMAKSPVLGAFAGHDDLISEEQIKLLQDTLTKNGRHADIKIYPDAEHAFFNDQREFYNEDAALDAWKRTLSFIEKTTNCSVLH